ncbi:MAG TPA: nucleotidyl transferase AbiEii/AbiGii toxin family protein [Gemmataceae bacterium]|nr:nucleotidyl transferase AbiEii/AbiGii toxin family protein [Gemmataceae bacterium]
MSRRFHSEILTATQQRALHQLGPALTRRRCYLGGGTALALYLGHRRSVDFDWFTPDTLSDPERLAHDLRGQGIRFLTTAVAPGTLSGTVSRIRVTVMNYGYPLLRPLRTWAEYGCRVAALADLAAMKLLALAQRGSKKDFVDIHALSQQPISLQQMLRWYRKKFAISDTAHLLYSLVYFDDAEHERMPTMLRTINWPAIKKDLRAWVTHTSR